MINDIKLTENNWVEVEGDVLKVSAHDIMLDSPERRISGGEFRRALVHGFADDLIINHDSDYPGGVTIVGEVRMSRQLVVRDTILIGREAFTPPPPPGVDSGMTRMPDVRLPGGMIPLRTEQPNMPARDALLANLKGTHEMIDVVELLKQMRSQIQALEVEVQQLKKIPG